MSWSARESAVKAELLLRVEPTDDGPLRLYRRDGTSVDHWITRLAVRERDPIGSPIPAWCGEPLDLDLALHCLFNNPVSRRKQQEAA